MKRAIIITTAALALAGCGDPADHFRAASPKAAAVSLDAPASNGTTTASTVSAETVGQRATFYELTRGITLVVNGSVGATLQLLGALTDLPPASVSSNVAVWGPYTPPHSLLTWKYVVNKTGASDYQYTLYTKLVIAPDANYTAVLTGTSHVVSHFVGSGDFQVIFSPWRLLDPAVKEQGGIVVHYDNTSAPRVVDVSFEGFSDGSGAYTPDGAQYKYQQNADHSGSFSFVAQADLDHDLAGILETASITSKWTSTGTGRSDITANGGSLGVGTASASECWNGTYQRTYFTDSWNPLSTEGDVSTCIP